MVFFLLWIILSLIVGAIGTGKSIGFAGGFFLSLILSPVIGFIITIVSKDKEDEQYKQAMLATQKEQQRTLTEIKNNASASDITEGLLKLKEMKDQGFLDEEEFKKAKDKLLSEP